MSHKFQQILNHEVHSIHCLFIELELVTISINCRYPRDTRPRSPPPPGLPPPTKSIALAPLHRPLSPIPSLGTPPKPPASCPTRSQTHRSVPTPNVPPSKYTATDRSPTPALLRSRAGCDRHHNLPPPPPTVHSGHTPLRPSLQKTRQQRPTQCHSPRITEQSQIGVGVSTQKLYCALRYALISEAPAQMKVNQQQKDLTANAFSWSPELHELVRAPWRADDTAPTSAAAQTQPADRRKKESSHECGYERVFWHLRFNVLTLDPLSNRKCTFALMRIRLSADLGPNDDRVYGTFSIFSSSTKSYYQCWTKPLYVGDHSLWCASKSLQHIILAGGAYALARAHRSVARSTPYDDPDQSPVLRTGLLSLDETYTIPHEVPVSCHWTVLGHVSTRAKSCVLRRIRPYGLPSGTSKAWEQALRDLTATSTRVELHATENQLIWYRQWFIQILTVIELASGESATTSSMKSLLLPAVLNLFPDSGFSEAIALKALEKNCITSSQGSVPVPQSGVDTNHAYLSGAKTPTQVKGQPDPERVKLAASDHPRPLDGAAPLSPLLCTRSLRLRRVEPRGAGATHYKAPSHEIWVPEEFSLWRGERSTNAGVGRSRNFRWHIVICRAKLGRRKPPNTIEWIPRSRAGEHRHPASTNHRHVEREPGRPCPRHWPQHIAKRHTRMKLAMVSGRVSPGLVALPDDRDLIPALPDCRSRPVAETLSSPSANQWMRNQASSKDVSFTLMNGVDPVDAGGYGIPSHIIVSRERPLSSSPHLFAGHGDECGLGESFKGPLGCSPQARHRATGGKARHFSACVAAVVAGPAPAVLVEMPSYWGMHVTDGAGQRRRRPARRKVPCRRADRAGVSLPAQPVPAPHRPAFARTRGVRPWLHDAPSPSAPGCQAARPDSVS
ncbi:hypothetical protein Acr_15g0012290 [Actinidia rufa]|uniref:Uncharacterized protein n=1 Tax=Actinidia rufa TaxID=165716 RepID=A0A7J0FVA8_9ERIC|nr:hypothetical protein Acr_15g0012290 [Actinidia rufa]